MKPRYSPWAVVREPWSVSWRMESDGHLWGTQMCGFLTEGACRQPAAEMNKYLSALLLRRPCWHPVGKDGEGPPDTSSNQCLIKMQRQNWLL